MLFYTALFVASVSVALITIWLGRALFGVASAFCQAILPSSKSNKNQKSRLTNHIKVRHSADIETKVWGSGAQHNPSKGRYLTPAPSLTSPGWPMANRYTHEQDGYYKPQNVPESFNREALRKSYANRKEKAGSKTGAPLREESSNFASNRESAKRRDQMRKTFLKTEGKPWGW